MNGLDDKEFLPEISFSARKQALALAQVSDLPGEFERRLTRAVRHRSIIAGKPEKELSETTKQYLALGLDAIEKVKKDGENASLSPLQEKGLESVKLIMQRPALLIRNEDFAPADDPWTKPLNDARTDIHKRVKSVGRIEVLNNGIATGIATGFLVAPGMVITNRHVIADIAVKNPSDPTRWQLRKPLRPQINFKAEYEIPESLVFSFVDEEIRTHPKSDLGLLKVSQQCLSRADAALPEPLLLTSEAPNLGKERSVYVVGYPATDNEGVIPQEVLDDIFGGVFFVKRLAPGRIDSEFEKLNVFAHDCSTLGGNSGSCVIDIETEMVVGLHYQGSYLKANYAVSLWKLKSDPLLADSNFD
jgi:S1-C subfamily serine protease